MEDRMDDVRAILDDLGSDRAVGVGVSEGGLMAELFAASHPQRTDALVLIGAETREENDADWPWGDGTRDEFERSMADWSRWSEGTSIDTLAPGLAGDPRARAWWGRLWPPVRRACGSIRAKGARRCHSSERRNRRRSPVPQVGARPRRAPLQPECPRSTPDTARSIL